MRRGEGVRVAQKNRRDCAPGLVLVQAARTKYHRLSGLNNRHVLLTVLETGKSKMRVLA